MNIYSYLLFIIIIFYLYSIYEYNYYFRNTKIIKYVLNYKKPHQPNDILPGYNLSNTNVSTHSNNMSPASYF